MSNISLASTWIAMDFRAQMLRGTLVESVSHELCATWVYSPAIRAKRYEDMTEVVSKVQWAMSPSTVELPGSLDSTAQCAGAVTCSAKVALRSGCSNTGKILRASAGSHCEYKYSASSNGST